MMGSRTMTGQVRLHEALEQSSSTLYVRVEDVSRVDDAAEVVAEIAIPIDHPLVAGAELPFTLTLPEINDQAHYSIRAHLDTTGTRRIDPGDRISMQSYPVATFGHPDEATILARKV
jgi:Type III secretion system lipoprotein chaperone (YscW)